MFELSLVRCSGSEMVPRKVIEDLEGAGALGRPSPNNRSPHQRTARVRDFAKGWSRNLLRRNQAKLTPTTAATLSTKTWVLMDKMAFRAVLSTESVLFMDKIESTGVSDIVPAKSKRTLRAQGFGAA